MRRTGSASDVAKFLSKGADDACCRWLCETAGNRTREEEDGLERATASLAGGALRPGKLLGAVDMLRRVS